MAEVGATGRDSGQWRDLADREAIRERMYDYAAAIDTQQWSLFASVFAPRIEVDFVSYFGTGKAVRLPREHFARSVRRHLGSLDATQHLMANPQVKIDSDFATCTMHMQATHVLHDRIGEPFFTIGGFYTNELLRMPTGWRISAVRLTVLWSQGDPDVMTDARARWSSPSS